MIDTDNPHGPIEAFIFPDEERVIIEDLRPERLVERVLVAVWCLRNKKYNLAHHTILFGPAVAIGAGFSLPVEK